MPHEALDDPRIPKKQRRRDEDPLDISDSQTIPPNSNMDCDLLAAPGHSVPTVPPISYKDKVTGVMDPAIAEDLYPIEDDDIELLEEDVQMGEVDVLGRRVGFNTLHNQIFNIWKPSHPLKLIDIENDYFLVKFSARSDYLKVLTDGPWTIFGHYLTVEPWSVDFSTTQLHPSRILAWVRLLGLPITCYKHSMLEAIGSRIGSVVKLDFQTDNGRRGRFARIAVKINLRCPLVSKIIVNGRIQLVEYESLPVVCFGCGLYGHTQELCPKLNPPIPDVVEPVVPICIRSTPSRFNPIYIVDDASAEKSHSTPPSISEHLPLALDSLPVPVISKVSLGDKEIAAHFGAKATAKGKSAVPVRKPLAVRNSITAYAHQSSNLVLSSRVTKGSSPTLSSTPSKHTAIALKADANPAIPPSSLALIASSSHAPRSSNMIKLESKLLIELESILDQEELLWKQKSRSDWIRFGDRNTKYYHAKAQNKK
ncbi:hypothetical protein GQ457_04G029180 [Hibiscus cannabinus]